MAADVARLDQIRWEVEEGVYLLLVRPPMIAEAMLSFSERYNADSDRQDRESMVRALDYQGVPHREIAKRSRFVKSHISRIIARHHRPAVVGGR